MCDAAVLPQDIPVTENVKVTLMGLMVGKEASALIAVASLSCRHKVNWAVSWVVCDKQAL